MRGRRTYVSAGRLGFAGRLGWLRRSRAHGELFRASRIFSGTGELSFSVLIVFHSTLWVWNVPSLVLVYLLNFKDWNSRENTFFAKIDLIELRNPEFSKVLGLSDWRGPKSTVWKIFSLYAFVLSSCLKDIGKLFEERKKRKRGEDLSISLISSSRCCFAVQLRDWVNLSFIF